MDDRQLARRLARDARRVGKAALRQEQGHARAVARHARLVARARHDLPVRAVTAAGSGALVLTGVGPQELWILSAVAALAAVRSLSRLLAPAPVPPALLPAALRPGPRPGPVALAPPPPPPHPGSAAFPAVRRLHAARSDLLRLVPLVAPAGREQAEQAWQAAGEADAALRWQAARLAAVEPHRGADVELLTRLEDGVRAQEALVAAMADLVAASADPLATLRLQDATDALHGLAQGLRELR